MERRFVCLDFERSSLSAYVSVAGNPPVRVMQVGDPSYDMRVMAIDEEQLEKFRLFPGTFGQDQPCLPHYPGGIDDIPA
jgi:hypothetical protein